MNLFDLSAKLTLNSEEFEKGIKNATNTANGLGSGMASASSSVGSSMQTISASAIAVGQVIADAFETAISKVVEYGQQIVQVGAQQESALAKVNTIMDQTVVNSSEMADAIRGLSSDMGVSVEELSDTVYNAISATGDTANAVQLAEQASKLATAGFTDTGSALSVLTTAMNAYGISADEASHISDSLMAVQNKGVTTVAELSASMGKAIASASAYGVDLENLESAYINITKAGISTAEGTTYISSMLKELGTDGSAVSDILKEKTGKSFDQLMKDGQSLGDVLGILQDSVDGDATALMNLWGSAEAGKASNAIISQGLSEFNENLKDLQTEAGATESAYETMADTFEHKTDVIKTSGQNLMANIYEGMKADMGGMLDIAMEAIDTLTAGFNENGIEGLAEAGGEILGNLIQSIIDGADDVFEASGAVLDAFARGFSENFDASNMLSAVTDLLSGFMNMIITEAPSAMQNASELVGALATQIGESLPELIPQAVEMLLTLVNGIVDNADTLIDGAISIITGLITGIVQALPMLLEQAPMIIMKLAGALYSMQGKILQAGWDLIVALVKGIIDGIPQLIEKAPEIIEKWKAEFTRQASKVKDIGKNLVEGIWKGISGAYTWITGKLKEWAGDVLKYIKGVFGIHSPSTVMRDQVGKFLAEGVVEGFTDQKPLDQIDKMVNSALGGGYDIPVSIASNVKDADPIEYRIQESLSGLSAQLGELGVNVVLQGDAGQIFRVVKQQDRKYKLATGRSAFA